MKGRTVWFVVLLIAVLLVACGPEATPTAEPMPTAKPSEAESPLPVPTSAEAGRVLKVMTHDSFDVSEQVVAAFQELCGCQVQFLQSRDTGLMLNQALLSKGSPLADVIYGIDNTFFSRALAGDILEPYQSPLLADILDDLELDPQFRLLPVDYGDVCLNYDKAWLAEHNLAPPADLADLTRSEYKALTVVENPATSSPGLAFLLATLAYVLCTTSLGLLISLLVKTQQAAMIISTVLSVIIAIQFSGFITPAASLQGGAWVVAHIFPALYYNDVVKGVFLKGVGFAVLWFDVAVLVLFACVVLVLCHALFRKRMRA